MVCTAFRKDEEKNTYSEGVREGSCVIRNRGGPPQTHRLRKKGETIEKLLVFYIYGRGKQREGGGGRGQFPKPSFFRVHEKV